MVYGLWFMVYGLWFRVYETWPLKPARPCDSFASGFPSSIHMAKINDGNIELGDMVMEKYEFSIEDEPPLTYVFVSSLTFAGDDAIVSYGVRKR